MTETPTQSAAEAFEGLRQEVALLRMAVQQLLNESQPPDYSQTLGKIMRDLKEASKGMTVLVNSPAIQTPAKELAKQISAAGTQARQQDQETIRDAARALGQATAEMDRHVARSRTASEQKRWLWRVGMSGVGGGAILGVMFAIGLLHMIPEYGAAWILGTGRWEAGERLMASASPETWKEVREGQTLYHDNRPVIKLCRTQADKTGVDQKCRLAVKAKTPTP